MTERDVFMTLTLNNRRMNEMLSSLVPLIEYKGKFGYVVARNYRMLSSSLIEYQEARDDLISKYGEMLEDDNGNKRLGISFASPNYQKFLIEMRPFDSIEHKIEIMSLSDDELPDTLSAKDILSISWMIKGWGDPTG